MNIEILLWCNNLLMSIGASTEICLKLKGEKQLFVYIKFRDILKESCDILVNETISDVKLNKVKIREGEVILKDLYDEKIKRNLKRPLTQGQIALTSKGNFPNNDLKYILHLSPLIYNNISEPKSLLKNNILRCLIVCEKEKMKKIAFPAMSTGIYGFPYEECAECFLEGILEFYRKYEINYVNKISLNINDYQIYEEFQSYFENKKQEIINIKYESYDNRILITEDFAINNFIKFRDIKRKYTIVMWLSLIIFIVIASHLFCFLVELLKLKLMKKTVISPEYSTRYMKYLDKIKKLKDMANKNRNKEDLRIVK